jgi:hypothetical protein
VSKQAPKRSRHLLLFFVSLVVLVAALAVFLFGIKMEDTAPGKGIISTTRMTDVRAPKSGRVQFHQSFPIGSTGVFPLRVGETLPEGAQIAMIESGSENPGVIRLGLAPPGAPPSEGRRWEVVEVPVQPGQKVAEGDIIARLLEVNATTGELLEPMVRLAIEEKYFSEVAAGQEVRIYSNMHHHRIHGVAKGKIDRLEPAGEPGPNGTRVFHAWVTITESPFHLKLGGSVRAEVILGRKPTYQVILEH